MCAGGSKLSESLYFLTTEAILSSRTLPVLMTTLVLELAVEALVARRAAIKRQLV